MNMNKGNYLKLHAPNCFDPVPIEPIPSPIPGSSSLAGTSYSATIGGGAIGAGYGGGAVSGEITTFTVPEDWPGWEAGEKIKIFGGAVSVGTAGVAGSAGAGRITLNFDGTNSSVLSILNEPSVSGSVGGAFIIGGRVMTTISREGGFSLWQIHFMMGGRVDAGGSASEFSVGTIKVPVIDSLEKAREVQARHGRGSVPEIDDYLRDNNHP
jgi:hypothetical protein